MLLDDQVTGNKALAISCRSEASLKKLALDQMGPACVQWLVDAVWIRKGPTKTWSISSTAPGTLPTDVALYVP